MKKFISLSQYPGTTGKYFYTEFFKHYNIDATYEPRASSDIAKDIELAKQENVNGISISMPFKTAVIPMLDSKHAYVSLYNSCNTIKIDKDNAVGYNADIAGVEYACRQIKSTDKVSILGAGAIGSMFIKYLEDSHYSNLRVCARSLNTWNERFKPADVIINCTALGTSTEESPYKLGQMPPDTKLVIDLAIKDNELMRQCMNYNIKYMTGREFYRAQFLKQFEIYTGIKPSEQVYDEIESNRYEKI